MAPGPLEAMIISSPVINGVVIFGRGRNQVGVLIERTPGVAAADVVEFRNSICSFQGMIGAIGAAIQRCICK
ncbi:hypothetical protein FIBSPDRAFT_878772 [Athelia psychrophila]|uniref:Uncharacterized protein n=1 Tax=Athelia psychrophila TaxID=1759441 RepID=A0A167UQN4_9AGAM|nr:hypothetical protein FIBSPDRAFT_878772 [Fibularhizoctonia sp. CBS 109695]